MKNNHRILIEQNKEFILVSSYITRGPLSMRDPEQDFVYLPTDVSLHELGKMIKRKLTESKYIDDVFVFNKILKSEKMQSLQKNIDEERKVKFGYKTKKAIYQHMYFLSIEVCDEELIIEPNHQYRLASYTVVEDQDNNIVSFKYPLNLTDEELGKATMEAFKYCTSIYNQG